jgi:hypothetical protein
MKTISPYVRRLACTGLALAVLSIVSTPPTALAQMKGAQRLMKLQTVEDLQNVRAGDTIVMSCPKCKDVYVQTVDKSLKGLSVGELKKTPIHLCGNCDTKIVTQGEGKQAKDTLVHTCKTCGSQDVSCCLMKKHGGATKGMEDKK